MSLNILFFLYFIAECRSSCASPSRCWRPNSSYQYLTSANTRTAKFCRLQPVWGICCFRCKQRGRWWYWNTLRSLAGEQKQTSCQLLNANSYQDFIKTYFCCLNSGGFLWCPNPLLESNCITHCYTYLVIVKYLRRINSFPLRLSTNKIFLLLTLASLPNDLLVSFEVICLNRWDDCQILQRSAKIPLMSKLLDKQLKWTELWHPSIIDLEVFTKPFLSVFCSSYRHRT